MARPHYLLHCHPCPGQGHSEITFTVGSLKKNNEIKLTGKNLHKRGLARLLKIIIIKKLKILSLTYSPLRMTSSEAINQSHLTISTY